MEVFVLHILKLNIIAAVIILLVKLLAILFKGQVSARWKYIIWLLITVSLCIPVRLPANFTLVDFKVQRSIQQNEQNSKTTDYAARPGERQQKMEIMSSVNIIRKVSLKFRNKRVYRAYGWKMAGNYCCNFCIGLAECGSA